MARVYQCGFETGTASDECTLGDANFLIDSTKFRSGAYSIKRATSATQNSITWRTGLNLSRVWTKCAFLVDSVSAPSAQTSYALSEFNDSLGNNQGSLYLFHETDGSTRLIFFNNDFSLFDEAAITIAANTWYVFETDFTKGAGSGAVQVYMNGVSKISVSGKQYGANNIDRVRCGFQNGGNQSRTFYYDDLEIDDAALCGLSKIIARQDKLGATSTYEDWEPASGAIGAGNWFNTPFSAVTNCRTHVLSAAQTVLVESFCGAQSGHGTEIIGSGDIIKSVKVGLVGKTAYTSSGISQVGTNQAGSAIDGGDVTLTFSTAPSAGDIIFVAGGHFKGGASYGPSTAGYTQVIDPAGSANNAGFGLWYKVIDQDDTDTDVTCLGSGTTTEVTSYVSMILRGADTTAIFDATTVQATGSSTNPNPGSITTVTNNAWVLAFAGSVVNDASITTPSGYGNFVQTTQNDTGNDFSAAAANITKATAGAEDPGTFGSWSTGNWRAITVAVRPASAAGSSASIRRRFGGVDTDTSITLTTSDAYYETSLFTATLTDLNSSEIGAVHGATSALQTVEDAWCMVSYLPTSNPTYDLYQEPAYVRPKHEMVPY